MTPEPLPSLAALLAEADRVEYDALALRRAFPRAVARVLHIAARSGSISRRAVSLNTELARAGVARRVMLAPTEPPLRIVDPMWAALLNAEPVEAEQPGVGSSTSEVSDACHAPPHAAGDAAAGRAQPETVATQPEVGPFGGAAGTRGRLHAQSL